MLPNINKKVFQAIFAVFQIFYPVGIYLFKVNNRNTGTVGEICSKLTVKTPERSQWRRSGVFIVNFKQISLIVLVSIVVDFEQVNTGWETRNFYAI